MSKIFSKILPTNFLFCPHFKNKTEQQKISLSTTIFILQKLKTLTPKEEDGHNHKRRGAFYTWAEPPELPSPQRQRPCLQQEAHAAPRAEGSPVWRPRAVPAGVGRG